MMYQRQDSSDDEEENHYQNFSIISSQHIKDTSDSMPQLNTFTNNNHQRTIPSTTTFSKSATLPNKKTTAPLDESTIEKKQKFHSLRPPKKPPRTHILDAPQKEGDKENIGPDVEEPTYDTPSNIMCTDVNLPSAIDDLSQDDVDSKPPLSSREESTVTESRSTIPPAPPIPASLQRFPPGRHAQMSIYDNVPRSMYDNVSDNEESVEDLGCMDTTNSSMNETFATSDDSYTPSGTLLRGEENNRSSYYERLNDNENDGEIYNISSPIPTSQVDGNTASSTATYDNKPIAAKRSPLTRMKSDTLDVQKRAKFAKNTELANQNFRPISMMNLAGATGGSKPIKKTPSNAGEIPKEVKTSLNTHRKGVFRRRMSIHSMLSWSKTPIKKPMVMTRDKQQRKDAVEVFKIILQCMGDKSSRKSFESLAVEVTTRGWQTTHLRDEIYVQLCKQTTGNDKLKSLRYGWELMTACLTIFPPSNKFHGYLEGYIYKYLDTEDLSPIAIEAQVDKYAKHCYKQLERICEMGAKRGLKGPTTDEIQSAIKRVFNPSMFGNTLEDIMEMQSQRFPDNRLPWILTTLTDAILLLNGLQTEGIFRVPGDIDSVNALKLLIDKWEGTKNNVKDPHTPASLLKLWFRDLYEPLIPQRFYDQCIHNADSPEICLNIVNSLPDSNRIVFSYLIRLLQAFMIPDNVHFSKMGEDNLAMVWAPNCLRCPSDDPREIFDNTRKEMTFLRTVIKTLDTSFLEGVV
ncbi:rho GTPase-activating protein 39-like [Clytia hemisphaerica]